MQVLPVLSNQCGRSRAGVDSGLKLQSRQVSDKSLEADRPEIAERPWQPNRTDPIDGEHVIERRRVVRKSHGPAFAGSQPQATPPKRDLPVGKVHADISIQ